MSKPLVSTIAVTPSATPLANPHTVNSPTSTAQTDAQLTTTTTESDSFEPTLSNKDAPKSPLDATTDSTTANSSILEHSAPASRDQYASASQANAPTTISGSTYSTLTTLSVKEFFTDAIPNEKITALLARNLVIAELRKYAQDHALIYTASLSLNPLYPSLSDLDEILMVVEQLILINMVEGKSKEETKIDIDNLFSSAKEI